MESNPTTTLPQIASNSLDDLRRYLDIIHPVAHQSPLELLSGATIGEHIRYIINHHHAIVKIALKATAPSIDFPEHFGVAPLTIHHRQESCAQ